MIYVNYQYLYYAFWNINIFFSKNRKATYRNIGDAVIKKKKVSDALVYQL